LHSSIPSRIIVLSSEDHYNVKSIPYEKIRIPTTLTSAFEAYQVSKLASQIFATELSKRLSEGVSVLSVNPGFVATNLFRKLPALLDKLLKQFTDSVEEGVRPILYCAVSEEMNGVSGQYIASNCRPKNPNPLTQNQEARTTLWQNSEAWIKDAFLSPDPRKEVVAEKKGKLEEEVQEIYEEKKEIVTGKKEKVEKKEKYEEGLEKIEGEEKEIVWDNDIMEEEKMNDEKQIKIEKNSDIFEEIPLKGSYQNEEERKETIWKLE